MIKVTELSRYYGKKSEKVAVDCISFHIEKGEIFGLLGPNGAGKTTTIKVLSTLLLPSSGKVEIDGYDIVKDRKEILKRVNLISGGERSLYWRLTARENLEYFGSLYNIKSKVLKDRVDELLEKVGLLDYKNSKVETFSKGMKQRLQIARGLINEPQILFLDEPTIGLDPSASHMLHDIILELKSKGTTIILTTHYMNEAEKLCDRVAFIRNGTIITIKTPMNHIRENQLDNLEEVYLKYFNSTIKVG